MSPLAEEVALASDDPRWKPRSVVMRFYKRRYTAQVGS
jgi:hypothetical protein